MHAKIEDHPTLYRDMYTQHIVQTDTSIVRKHEARMINIQKEEEQQQEIASIKSDLTEIKEILRMLLKSGAGK